MGRASFSLRRASARPRTRPAVKFRARSEPRPNGIQKDISFNPPEFLSIPNQPVVTFMLPERPSHLMKLPVGLTSGAPLNPPHNVGNVGPRRNKHVDMVRHDHPRVQVVVLAAILNRASRNLSHLGHLKIPRPNDSPIQQPVHTNKSLAQSHRLPSKTPSGRQRTMEAKGNEQRPAQHIQMGQMTSHRMLVPSATKKSHVKKAGSSPPQAEACPTA